MRLKNTAATIARIISAMIFFIVVVLIHRKEFLAASKADLNPAQARPIALASAKQAKGTKPRNPTPKAVTEIQREARHSFTDDVRCLAERLRYGKILESLPGGRS
jgi:hypothetical protein